MSVINDNPVIAAAKQYLQDTARYVTMRQIGKNLGISSHAVGRKLKEVGLRTSEGHPSEKARTSSLTKTIFTEQGFALALWHQERIMAILRPLIEQLNSPRS